jgi:hypothetical protein
MDAVRHQETRCLISLHLVGSGLLNKRRTWLAEQLRALQGRALMPPSNLCLISTLLRLQEFHQLLGGLGSATLALAFRERACFEVPVPCFCREAIDFIG